METLAKINYDNQSNLRFFIEQYKKAQEMIKETHEFYLSFLLSKARNLSEVIKDTNVKWLEYSIKRNTHSVSEWASLNHDHLYGKKLKEYIDKKNSLDDVFRKNGDYDGASIIIYSPLFDAIKRNIQDIQHNYERLVNKRIVYALSCGKYNYEIKDYIGDDSYKEIRSDYIIDKYNDIYGECPESNIYPCFKDCVKFDIYYKNDELNISEYSYGLRYNSVIGDEEAFFETDDLKKYQKNRFSKNSKALEKKAEEKQRECYAWMLHAVRTENDFKKDYPTVYNYYVNKLNKIIKEIEIYKKKYTWLFDSSFYKNLTDTYDKCIKKVLLKDFIKNDITYTPFQGFNYLINTVGWHNANGVYENYQLKTKNPEEWYELMQIGKIPIDSSPGSWSNYSIPQNVIKFGNGKINFSDYDYYDSEHMYDDGSWLYDAIDINTLTAYVYNSWNELIDICKNILLSSADKDGCMDYSVCVGAGTFNYAINNLNSKVIVSNDYNTVYYVGHSENDLRKYNINYNEKNDTIICSRTEIRNRQKYKWPSDAPTIRTTINTSIVFNCDNGNLIGVYSSSSSDEINNRCR